MVTPDLGYARRPSCHSTSVRTRRPPRCSPSPVRFSCPLPFSESNIPPCTALHLEPTATGPSFLQGHVRPHRRLWHGVSSVRARLSLLRMYSSLSTMMLMSEPGISSLVTVSQLRSPVPPHIRGRHVAPLNISSRLYLVIMILHLQVRHCFSPTYN
ncbi:hypothetical protein K439DRAFT_601697 [Ramaria rubella]|nr:hypothetical protein K439DRAFT_601697 [Ramaria rubella]